MGSELKPTTLRSRRDFINLKDAGKRVHPAKWLMINYMVKDEKMTRLGWTVPKYVGGAVLRNKMKRWCREFFRGVSFSAEKGLDVNVVFKRMEGDFYKSLPHNEFALAMQRGWASVKKAI